MLRFILARLIQFPLILAIIYVGTFTLVWIVPGSPFEQTDRRVSPNTERWLKEQFHADDWRSFLLHYPRRIIFHGDFGPSFTHSHTVNQILGNGLPVSMMLGFCAMAIATTVGVGIGTLAAVRRGGAIDWLSLSITLVGISLPSFVTALALLMLLSGDWLPGPGWGTLEWSAMRQQGVLENIAYLWDYLRHLLLPSLALSLAPMAYITRLMRVSMIDVLSNDYVRTARAKGLSRSRVIWKHSVRNAILPVLSFIGPAAAATLVGSFVVEQVFNIPGLGRDFVQSVQNRDQTLILGTVMVYSLFLLTLNLVVDVCYALVDPRIDLQARRA